DLALSREDRRRDSRGDEVLRRKRLVRVTRAQADERGLERRPELVAAAVQRDLAPFRLGRWMGDHLAPPDEHGGCVPAPSLRDEDLAGGQPELEILRLH